MNSKLTAREREYLGRLKLLPCGCCGAAGPSEAHHIVQGLQWITIPLCVSCHRTRNGIHGEKIMWKIMKKTELSVLNETIKLLNER